MIRKKKKFGIKKIINLESIDVSIHEPNNNVSLIVVILGEKFLTIEKRKKKFEMEEIWNLESHERINRSSNITFPLLSSP